MTGSSAIRERKGAPECIRNNLGLGGKVNKEPKARTGASSRAGDCRDFGSEAEDGTAVIC